MGVLDKVRQKVSDHHADAEIDHSHNSGQNPNKSDTSNWIEAGQGGPRSDDHGIRAGSLTSDDTNPSIRDPAVHERLMSDGQRAGAASEQK